MSISFNLIKNEFTYKLYNIIIDYKCLNYNDNNNLSFVFVDILLA